MGNAPQRLSAALIWLLVAACASQATPEPTGRPSPTPPARAEAPMPTPESPCPSVDIRPPGPSRFTPVDGAGAIAYSGDGLTLIHVDTGAVSPVHPLSTLGLDGVDRAFAWSPDAARLAFLHTDPGPEGCARGYLLLADLAAGRVRPLLDAPRQYSRPAWSPDGRWLALTDEAGRVWLVSADDGQARALSQDALGGVAPAWPDAAHVVYAREAVSGAGGDLMQQPLDGGPPVALLSEQYGLDEFALAPDGKRVAFFGGILVIAEMPSGSPRRVAGFEAHGAERLQWSPDGRTLLARAGLAGIFLVDPQVADPVTQVDVLGLLASQAWAPDSERFATLVGAEGQTPRLAVYDLGTRALTELPVVVSPPFEVAWGPR